MLKPANELRLNLLHEMKRIRAYEEGIATRYHENKMRCPTHLSVGQEAVPAALSQILRKEDLAVSTHRSHAHYLAKGGSGSRMLAEIYGKATGCSGGKGGSMHLVDLSVGFKGSTAIVGNTIPIGVGIGLALKLDHSDNISVVFVGDAAVEEGVFWESVNFAVLKKLPVLFVCENNFYSVYSHLRVRQPLQRQIHRMAEGMGLKIAHGDGNNVEESHALLSELTEHVRRGEGPGFAELVTYRWREHCGPNYDNNLGYRTEKEFQEWKAKDPVAAYEKKLLAERVITDASLKQMNARVEEEVARAFEFAEKSPYPSHAEAFTDIFAEENTHAEAHIRASR
jgi:TPP-dependent pyruvate/acetoin dehydrogenase alpha subunit